MIDPAYGMPRQNWGPQSSFVDPIPVPTAQPGAAPLVCIPAINRSALELILGCMDQLRNPATWDSSDPATIAAAVGWADECRHLVATAVDCEGSTLQLRVDSCQLQYSNDGTTWTEVPGWDSILSSCLTTQLGQDLITINPPNPNGLSTSQMACSIAAYVAQQIIQEAITQLAAILNEGSTLIAWSTGLLGTMFRAAFPLTTGVLLGLQSLFAWASTEGYTIVSGIASDPVFWDDIKCAIYTAIVADGKITTANWATARANIRAISYGTTGVVGALSDFLDTLDINTVLEWQQLAGLNEASCTDCSGTWCRKWDFLTTNGGWVVFPGGYVGHYAGGYWTTAPSVADAGVQQLVIELDLGANRALSAFSVEVEDSNAALHANWNLVVRDASNAVVAIFNPANPGAVEPRQVLSWSGFAAVGRYVSIGVQYTAPSASFRLYSVELQGPGANPFGGNNCTY